MLHTILDATGVVLRVHYKSVKCDVLFSQGSIRTVCRCGRHFSYMSKIISSSLQQCKNYKNRSRFSKVMITNVLPPFYGLQCILQLEAARRRSSCSQPTYLHPAAQKLLEVVRRVCRSNCSTKTTMRYSCRKHVFPSFF